MVSLKEGEKIKAEYDFAEGKGILTTNRLIFVSQGKEEHYPLSKIVSVKLEQHESTFRTKVLGYSVFFTIVMLILTGYFLFGPYPIKQYVIIQIPFYLLLAYLIRFGLKPETITARLVIDQMGGRKVHILRMTKKLKLFIDRVNESLL